MLNNQLPINNEDVASTKQIYKVSAHASCPVCNSYLGYDFEYDVFEDEETFREPDEDDNVIVNMAFQMHIYDHINDPKKDKDLVHKSVVESNRVSKNKITVLWGYNIKFVE